MQSRVAFIALVAAMAWTSPAHAEGTPPASFIPCDAQGALGLVIAKAQADAPLVIQEVLDRGPAQAAGLMVDDQILAIDGIEADDLDLETAASRLRGPVGTWVTLAILSGDNRFDLSVQRAAVEGMPAS